MLHERSVPVLPTHLAPCTPELVATVVPRYEQVQQVLPEVEWAVHAPYIAAIQELKKVRHAVILFMAETAKLLNPEKTVLIPNLEAGAPRCGADAENRP